MSKKIISTELAPQAIGPYSQAVQSNGFIFVSGQLPVDYKTGTTAEPDIAKQTEMVLLNIKAILESTGLSLENVVKTTVFMTDLKEFAKMNEVYAKFFKNNPPARATLEVKSLPKSVLIEIEAIAEK
jgi:2-iminobutanoate/2-iminopropanoate deaminase